MIDDVILEAAARCVTCSGLGRVTMTEIARSAGVSRPTLYRRWPDAPSVLAALIRERIRDAIASVPSCGGGREALVERVVEISRRIHGDEVVMSYLRSSADAVTIQIGDLLEGLRREMLDAVVIDLEAIQAQGLLRAGDCRRVAAMGFLVAQSTIRSARIVESVLDGDELFTELSLILNAYLAP